MTRDPEQAEGAGGALHMAEAGPTRPAPGLLELRVAPGEPWSGPFDRATLRGRIYGGQLTGDEVVRAPGELEAAPRPLRAEAWATPLLALLERDRRGVRHSVGPTPSAKPGVALADPVGPDVPGAEAAPPAPVPAVVVPEAPRDRGRLVMVGVATFAVCAILLVVAWVALQT